MDLGQESPAVTAYEIAIEGNPNHLGAIASRVRILPTMMPPRSSHLSR